MSPAKIVPRQNPPPHICGQQSKMNRQHDKMIEPVVVSRGYVMPMKSCVCSWTLCTKTATRASVLEQREPKPPPPLSPSAVAAG